MQFHWLFELLGWLALPLLAILALVLLSRRAHREFPLFFLYVVAAIVASLVRWAASQISYRGYYFTYWISDLTLFLLGIIVTYDLFARRVFAGYRRIRFYQAAVPIAGIIVLALTFTAIEVPQRTTLFLIASRVLSILEVGLLAFFGCLMLLLDRKWTDYEIGIASGFALDHCVQLGVALARWKWQYQLSPIVDQLPTLAYDLACILWIIYCSKIPEQRGVSTVTVSSEWIAELKRLERQLRDWLGSKHRAW